MISLSMTWVKNKSEVGSAQISSVTLPTYSGLAKSDAVLSRLLLCKCRIVILAVTCAYLAEMVFCDILIDNGWFDSGRRKSC